ncbi:MAG: hypothetical protein RLZZ65_1595 [Bacteroidota bacterium]|jgi:hypothetical protein
MIFGQKQIDDQFNGWAVYQGNHHLNGKFDLYTEYQFRRSNGFTDWQQSLTRIGLDYKYNANCTFSAGYGWIVTFPYGAQPIAAQTNENRIWQQVNLKQQIGSVQIQQRYRLEQRFIDTIFRQRVRYRAQLILPLQDAYQAKGKGLFANVNDEVFLGFGKGIGKNVLDQNRFIAALGYKFSPDFNIQVGYLNQMVFKSDGLRIERNHTLWTSVVYNLDFTKKK